MRAKKVLPVILAALVVLVVAAALFVTQPMWPGNAPPPGEASPVRLRRHVKFISSIVPRNPAFPTNLDTVSAYIRSTWEQDGLTVTEQGYEAAGVPVRNLIVRFGDEGGTRIIVGAHYDSFERSPGADDDASGVAGLLELGRLLREHPSRGAVELVAYALEEPPYFGTDQMGSAVHAHSLRLETEKVRGMIALEMIGTFSDAKRSQRYPSPVLSLLYPSRGDFVAVAGRVGDYGFIRRVKRAMADATDLPVRSITAPPGLAGQDLSDNRSYWNERFRAVMVTDTAFHRNRAYHTAEDTAERLDYERMAKVVTGVYAAVRALSPG